MFLFIGIPFVFALWRRTLRPADQLLGGARRVAMDRRPHRSRWVASIPAVQTVLPFGLQGSLRLGLAILAVLAFFVAIYGGLTSTQRIAVSMLAFAFAVTAGTDIVFVWDRMNTIFKFYLEAWLLFAAACARRPPSSGAAHPARPAALCLAARPRRAPRPQRLHSGRPCRAL